jgi:ParB-like chromosome segregation protein Spo0J
MKFHPIADIFPMMDPVAFEELAEDIKLNGLLEPVVTYEEKILDGRNRYKACERESVEPRFEAYEGDDPLSYVISLNLKRRHLDISQRAMVAARISNLGEGRPSKKTGAKAPVSKAHAAQIVRIDRATVTRAKHVLAKGTKGLIEAVETGKIAVTLAAKLADQDKAIQAAAVADPDRAAILLKKKTREGHEADLATKIRGLPNKRFGLILADPEWRFEVWNEDTGNDRAAARGW